MQTLNVVQEGFVRHHDKSVTQFFNAGIDVRLRDIPSPGAGTPYRNTGDVSCYRLDAKIFSATADDVSNTIFFTVM